MARKIARQHRQKGMAGGSEGRQHSLLTGLVKVFEDCVNGIMEQLSPEAIEGVVIHSVEAPILPLNVWDDCNETKV